MPENNPIIKYGWRCPVCYAVMAPWMDHCVKCHKLENETVRWNARQSFADYMNDFDKKEELKKPEKKQKFEEEKQKDKKQVGVASYTINGKKYCFKVYEDGTYGLIKE